MPLPAAAGSLRGRRHVTMDELKRQAATRALEAVRDGMKLGLGTGSTAKHFVELLGEKVRAGMKVIGVPTSEATRADAMRCGIALTTLDDIDRLDLTVDGADEIDPRLNLIKGGGGALLREKIVAAASDRMIVIADDSKWVDAARPLSATGRGHSVWSCGDPARHGGGICEMRRFRANGGPEGQGRPRFCHRWRPLDCRCPPRTDSGRVTPGWIAERDTGRCRARTVHRSCQHGHSGRRARNSRYRAAHSSAAT